ncbi:MAG: response regulator [Bacteroidota bacterium]
MPTQILFVDDEPQFERLINQRFRQELRNGTYQFTFAGNGKEAIEIIKQGQAIDMVLTDINMPIMDGLTFLSQLKAMGSLLKVVVVSAYGDMENIRKAMNLGAFDFITKPIDFSDLKITIGKTLAETELIHQAQKAKALAIENEQLAELSKMKSHFFTNISHELRTPLTIINGVTTQLKEDPNRWGKVGVEMIQRNSERLLDLINQILDLRKLESGKMTLQPIQSDVVVFCKYIVDSFAVLAQNKGVQLHFLSDDPSIMMDYDLDKLSRMLSNLISNAIKHTPSDGHIYLILSTTEAATQQLKIKVKDTGRGIGEEELPHIFDRFYQDPNSHAGGTGVGLSLVKELITLMEGQIEVESQLGKGTAFILTLPIYQHAPLAEDPLAFSDEANLGIQSASTLSTAVPQVGSSLDEALPSLLIVEDNEDVLAHLLNCLGDQYQPYIANNGEEGIAKALEKIPDIIISDVMMPIKNGFELCATLKQDERTSHIPIVLLTAKADLDNRIEGLSKGADAYLSKPFDQKELSIVLDQLLKLRANLRNRYAGLAIAEEASQAEGAVQYNFSSEDAFIKKAIELIEDHLNDTQFTVPIFCKKMGMSYPVIHRKLSALIGKSPALFIRAIRLHQAKKRLDDPSKTIAEIAYETGFTDPKYFSRAFSAEFSAPPSAFR